MHSSLNYLSKGRRKTNLFVPKLSKERRQTEVFVPQLSKDRRQSEVFVPQLSKERRQREVFVPQLSKERRQSEVFVPQLSMIWHCYYHHVQSREDRYIPPTSTLSVYVLCNLVSPFSFSILCYFGIPFPCSCLSISWCVSILSTRWQHIFLWCTFSLILSLYVQDVHPFYGWDDKAKLLQNTVSLCSGCASFLSTGWQAKLLQNTFPSLLSPYIQDVHPF